MAGQYTWLPVTTAVQQLAQRLNDPNMNFWVYDELLTYISTSLRQFNSLTWMWRADFQYNDPVNIWNSLGSLPGSPRLRTITDVEVYAELEYLLLEPSNLTGTWTGTNQFGISVLSQALQRRRDEMLQVSNANQSLLAGIALTPNTIQTLLPDTTIDVERVRYLPAIASPTGTAASGASSISLSNTYGILNGQLIYGTGVATGTTVTGVGVNSVNISIPTSGAVSGTLTFTTPNTLYRDDTVAQEFYEAPLYQQTPGTPTTFSLSSEPPLSWLVDIPPAQPGTYEAVVLQSGTPFNPPTPTLLGIPDDFAWVLEWGALADLLGQESESTDRERSAYCLKRYQDGLQLMLKTPWIELGKVNGVAVSCDSIVDLDRFDPDWDSNPTGFGPVIVTGGMDFIAAPVGQNIGCTLLGNAPIVDSNNNVQVSRSDWDAVILMAQSRAMFKCAGAEFKASLELEKSALQMCASNNVRLKSMGAFSDVIDQRGNQQERDMNRFNNSNKGK